MTRRRILLIAAESSPLIQCITARLIAIQYTTVIVPDANEAWRALLERDYDAVIIEAQEDDTEGLLACRMLRRRWYVPIVLLSHNTDKRAGINGYRAGADIYLRIPFDMDEFTARLESLLRRAEWNDRMRRQRSETTALYLGTATSR